MGKQQTDDDDDHFTAMANLVNASSSGDNTALDQANKDLGGKTANGTYLDSNGNPL